MAGFKKELIGKRFNAEGKTFTVYAVSGPGVFAHDGDVMETNEKGEVMNPRYFPYDIVEANLVTAGRPTIGVTKRIALTLPQDTWDKIEELKEAAGEKQSAVLRSIIEDYFRRSN